MLVSQSDYARWEQMYGDHNRNDAPSDNNDNVQNRHSEGATRFADFAEQFGRERQTTADISAQNTVHTGGESSGESDSGSHESQQTFIQSAYEKLLANRLGIDQEKMEELKQEIENTKAEIKALEGQKPLTDNQKKELESLEEKLSLLEDALKELVEQGVERSIEDDVLKSRHKQLAEQYQNIQKLSDFTE